MAICCVGCVVGAHWNQLTVWIPFKSLLLLCFHLTVSHLNQSSNVLNVQLFGALSFPGHQHCDFAERETERERESNQSVTARTTNREYTTSRHIPSSSARPASVSRRRPWIRSIPIPSSSSHSHTAPKPTSSASSAKPHSSISSISAMVIVREIPCRRSSSSTIRIITRRSPPSRLNAHLFRGFAVGLGPLNVNGLAP